MTTKLKELIKDASNWDEVWQFVHALDLKSSTEWYKYCQEELAGRKSKPEDILTDPPADLQKPGLARHGRLVENGYQCELEK